jgi:cell cycle protein kinase DBF2
MATSPSKSALKMPMPPALAHTRSDRPSTPTQERGFVSPTATPAGSPSKKQAPPGALDLPDVFDNAMRLAPTAGNASKATLQSFRDGPHSPTKDRGDKSADFRASVVQNKPLMAPASPTKGKENTPPAQATHNAAAASRQEIYKPREQSPSKTAPRGLTPETLEKLQKPSVRRLANVTQLCMLIQTSGRSRQEAN